MSVHPFDIKTAILAKHAQHVVLIHFPIALFIVGVAFDSACTMDEAGWLPRPTTTCCRGDLDGASGRDGNPRVAVRTRGTESERHPIGAHGPCVRLDCGDLARLVDSLSRATQRNRAAFVPHSA